MLLVRLIGEVALEADGAPLEPPASPRVRALLAWLALHPGAQPRSRVAGVFWPDVLETSARGSLRAALTALRGALGPAAAHLVATRESVALEDVVVDVRELDALLAAGELERAVQLGAGELLPGVDADWAHAEREEHRHRIAEAHARLTRAGGARALAHARHWIALDPLSEDAARTLMAQLAAAGDRAAALTAFRALAERLRTRLGVAPSAQTRALADAVRHGEAPPAASADVLPPALAAGADGPFVGRGEELERLDEDLAATRRGICRLALVAGEPGIGKTRLAAQFARRAHECGALVLYGRATEDTLIPYQPFVEALRTHARADGAAAASAPAELALLVPELAAGAGAGEPNRYRLFEAVRELLAAWAAARPVVLVIDDLQWIDDASALLLRHLATAHDRAPVLLLTTCSDRDLRPDHPLTRVLADIRRERTVDRVVLAGLGEAEVRALAAAWTGEPADEQRTAALCGATGGNPFLVEELLRDGSAAGVPQGVREVIASRLLRLSDDTRDTLVLAAVVGREFTLDVLARTSALDEERLLAAVDEALHTGLVCDDPARPGGYRWAHAVVRDAVYGELTAVRRSRLHAQVVTAFEALEGPPTDERLERLAYHCARAGALGTAARAVDYARAAGERALAKLAFEAAAVHFECALQSLALAGNDPEARAGLQRALADARELARGAQLAPAP
jgi:DNA-binding SARP family transcriptional activator